jgi:aspartate aminotransferase-like enzyme
MLECTDMLKTTLDAPVDARMIFLTASGTGAMEAVVMNLFTANDKLLIISGGTFGKRFKHIAEIYRIPAEVISLEWNEAFTSEMLCYYENAGITGMLVNMCETSTGQLYPMDDISAFCKRNGICLVVDAISSLLCDPFSMKDLQADAVIISSQKGLALQPGMSFVALTNTAFENRCLKNNPRTMYFRFTDYERDILRGQTPYTPAVVVINQLHEKLGRLLKDGVESHTAYIAGLAGYFRGQLFQKTNFTCPSYPLSSGVTPVYCPQRNAMNIFEYLKNQYDIYITPCAGELAQILFRVAHMSCQLTTQDIDELIALIRLIEKEK